MITMPQDFDTAQLITDLFALAAPFVAIAFIVACGFLIANILKTINF
ncbi:hypothetical protein [Desulfofustis glycolicus]|uniref:Uncharacterized protein n=1 Tax=Desulfofustis glycolicus DSM 9705 TaxID=1121409 RepID=A0A1M5SFH6_9BACT|nr:hypothetical protein [Desulfofustis glycolicus]MCB2216110.1 hypothetical protein [Desulfobulbaceae bacterium]SHH37294.1 hypothetical protein SAMN02745124_00324 [Desulfofustis glycolicus DSM 9705]